MTPSGTLAVAWYSSGEQPPNSSIVVSLLELGSPQFTAGVVVSERVNYSNQNPVLFWDNETQILHLYHTQQFGNLDQDYSDMWHLYSKDRGEYTLEIYVLKRIILIFVRCNMVNS